MEIELTIHSFSLWYHFAHQRGFDAIAYADLAEELGLSGISLSLNDPNYRHLGGRETKRMDCLRERLQRSAMSLEIDTSGTDPDHMKEMLEVAARMGAESLRTYTRHTGSPGQMMAATIEDLGAVGKRLRGSAWWSSWKTTRTSLVRKWRGSSKRSVIQI
jgi:sugar phosphate isomerase/epimerase